MSYEFNKNSKAIKQEILDKYGYLFCQRCKRSSSFKWETHHLIYRSEAPKHPNLHHPQNLFFCCGECHNLFHEKKSNRDQIVRERQLYLLFPEIKSLNEK